MTDSAARPAIARQDRADILASALPALRRNHGKTMVIKYGGNAMTDPALQQDYLQVQQGVLARVMTVIKALKAQGVIAVDEADIRDLAHNIKLLVTFWISYLKTQAPDQAIDQASVYQGVLKVLLLFKPYATEQARPRIARLQQHYEALAQ